MQRAEPHEDERALATLARLHGIQRSYIDTRGRRIRAGRAAILATLAALGAPVAGMRDVPGAIRERLTVELGASARARDRRVGWAAERADAPGSAGRAGATFACRIELRGRRAALHLAKPGEVVGGGRGRGSGAFVRSTGAPSASPSATTPCTSEPARSKPRRS